MNLKRNFMYFYFYLYIKCLIGTRVREYVTAFAGGKKLTLPSVFRKLTSLDEYSLQLDDIPFNFHKFQGKVELIPSSNCSKPKLFGSSDKQSIQVIEVLKLLNHVETEIRLNIYSTTGDVEMVDWITYDGSVVASLPRYSIHKFNLLHRGIGAILMNQNGHIFVHKRSSKKRIFPSLYDMFIGGVSASSETPEQTFRREISEEIGINISSEHAIQNHTDSRIVFTGNSKDYDIDSLSALAESLSLQRNDDDDCTTICKLGQTTILTDYNHCIVDCFLILCGNSDVNSITFRDGEIESGKWMTLEEIDELVRDKQEIFVPDGLQVWRALPNMLSTYTCL